MQRTIENESLEYVKSLQESSLMKELLPQDGQDVKVSNECSTWNYLPKWTSNTEISEAETPLIRDACPIDSGLILLSFCLPSAEIDFSSE